MKEANGKLNAQGMKLAIIASRFNSFLVSELIKGAVDAFVRLGGNEKDLMLVRVPGAYEIPVVARKLAERKEVEAVVALGAVVRGATTHADLINEATARAFTEISLSTGKPVVNGIVAAENLEQAVERCGTKQGNKGFSACETAIEMVNLLNNL